MADSASHPNEFTPYCRLPLIPDRPLDDAIDPQRAFLIRYIEKKWVNHTVLHYHFLDTNPQWQGSGEQKQAVRDAFTKWKALGIGLAFEEVNEAAEAEIRIGFEPGGSWSFVGRDAIDHAPDPNERTMNFGWDLTTAYGADTALHEIGHAMGFPHEHQNPNAGIVWNEEAVMRYFSGPPNNWNPDQIEHNILRKIDSEMVQGSPWDKNSIMHYGFPAGLIMVPEKYQNEPLRPEPGLSATDIAEARRFYPDDTATQVTELMPYVSQPMKIEPGEQLDFLIRPEQSRRYNIQTFGELDTVLVLFEQTAQGPVFLDGDDDSGSDYNALLEARLLRGRSYYLRARLYYTRSSGQGAVMLW